MILSNISQLLKQNKKIFYYLGFILAVFLFSSDVTFAATDPKDYNLAQKIASGVNGLLSIVSLLLGLITYLATIFLSPEWINGSFFGMSEKFKDIWILVSNLVYFIFAFILIWIAFMNIIGKPGEQYQLKLALPKFIVGVLIVPFSWFLVQFILSISAILTVSALTLPMDTFPDHESALNRIKVSNEITFTLDSKTATGFVTQSGTKKSLAKIMANGEATNAIFGVISMYTYGIIGLDNVDDIKINIDSVKQIGDIVVKLIFDVLFVVVYLILIVVLGLVLMIRGIYIWIYIMISPLFGLMYFFDKKEGGEGFFAKFNIKEFIALAMVPVYTMLALSFGLLFIYIVGSGMSSNAGGDSVHIVSEDKQSSISIGEGPNKVTLIMKGAVGTKSVQLSNFVKAAGDTTNDVLGVVGQLILKLFGIVVLWGSIMAAMRTSAITKAITEPIHAFGGSVGKIMQSAPGNIPIFGGQSMNSMSSAANTLNTHITGKASTKGANFAGKFIQEDPNIRKIQDTVRGVNVASDQLKKTQSAQEAIKLTNTTTEKEVTALVKALNQIGFKDLKTNDILNKTKTEISNILLEKGKTAGLNGSLDSAVEYKELLDKATKTETKKGVGDNIIIERTLKEYDDVQSRIIGGTMKVKLEKDKEGMGSVFIKGVNGIEEHRIEINGGINKSFNNLRHNDKDELVDFYNNLDDAEQGNIEEILKDLKIGDGTKDYGKAIKKYIEEKNKK